MTSGGGYHYVVKLMVAGGGSTEIIDQYPIMESEIKEQCTTGPGWVTIAIEDPTPPSPPSTPVVADSPTTAPTPDTPTDPESTTTTSPSVQNPNLFSPAVESSNLTSPAVENPNLFSPAVENPNLTPAVQPGQPMPGGWTEVTGDQAQKVQEVANELVRAGDGGGWVAQKCNLRHGCPGV